MFENLKYEYRTGLKRIELESKQPDVIPSAEKIILQIGGRTGSSFDAGALCYLKRKGYKEDGLAWSKRGRKVVLDTLNEERVHLFNLFIPYLFDLNYALGTKRICCQSISQFIEFCEKQSNGVNLLKTEKTQQNAAIFLSYIQAFYSKTKNVQVVWDFFCYLYEIEGVESRLNLQHWYGHERQYSSVQPLFDDEVKKVTSFY